MIDVPRISAEEARRRVTGGGALLVCAYDDETKCNTLKLEGAISLASFHGRLAGVPKDQEIIFYCA
jgi:hypothetical protein